MARRSVHQVLVSASKGDAITNMALAIRDELRRTCRSEIYSYWRHGGEMERECRPLDELPGSSETDLLVYHMSIGHPIVGSVVTSRSEPLAMCYHNITPAKHYEDFNPEFAASLRDGRAELACLADRVCIALADSEYNASELRDLGYVDVRVAPAGLDPFRLTKTGLSPAMTGEMTERFPNGYVIAVGQLLPHKRIEQVIETLHLMNSTHWRNVGLVLCGAARQPGYLEALHRFTRKCAMADVHFTGPVSERRLASLLIGARAYIGMSDHEGLCIPPLEAASLGIPVVIKGAGAVPETMQDAAIVLPSDATPQLAAEALHIALADADLRLRLKVKGHLRAAEFAEHQSVERAAHLLLGAAS